jgi:hypothetical protein
MPPGGRAGCRRMRAFGTDREHRGGDMSRKLAASVLIGATLAVSCGGGQSDTTIEMPAGATFCSVYAGEYQEALDSAVPVTDEGFAESSMLIAAWAEALVTLAPPEIAAQAQDNYRYHLAQAELKSAADFIPGSNAMHEWARSNC